MNSPDQAIPNTNPIEPGSTPSPQTEAGKYPAWYRVVVTASLFLLIALIAFSCLVISKIDKSVNTFGGGLVAIVSFGAVLFGILDPKADRKEGWTKVAFRWIDRCSKSKSLSFLHVTLMIGFSVIVIWGGLASVYQDIKVDPQILAQPKYRFWARDFLGSPEEVKLPGGELDPLWLPFVAFREPIFRVTNDDGEVTRCAIVKMKTACEKMQPDSSAPDYVIGQLIDRVDFRTWHPFVTNSPVANSVVNREFTMGITRQTERDFSRWTASSSIFPPDCMVRSANAHCEEKPLGSLEPNRNNSIIVLDKSAFPIGVETPLTYDVDYKNSFTFTASVRSNECIGCDVAFFSVYPVNDYHMTMIFPPNWTWDRVIVTVSDEDNHYKTTVEDNTNRKSAFEFARRTLPAGTHITFLVFPDKNILLK